MTPNNFVQESKHKQQTHQRRRVLLVWGKVGDRNSNMYESLLSQRPRGEHFCDEIDRIGLLIKPRIIKGHDVLVLKLFQYTYLGKQAVPANTFCCQKLCEGL